MMKCFSITLTFLLLNIPQPTLTFLHYHTIHHHHPSSTTTSSALFSTIPRTQIIKTLTAQHDICPILSARLVDLTTSSLNNWTVERSPFLRPNEISAILSTLSKIPDLKVTFAGGYDDAERRRAFFSHVDLPVDWEEELRGGLAVCDVTGNFKFDGAGHRDFLGAVLGTGIERDRVGDILVKSLGDDGNDDDYGAGGDERRRAGGGGAQIIVDPDVVGNINAMLTRIRTVPVKSTIIPLTELKIPKANEKEVTSIEVSMRLDALASAGIGMSRSKMVDKIKAGEVLVNWKDEKNRSKDLEVGDVVTVRGKGRVVVKDVTETSKGKLRVVLTRIT